MNTLIQQGLGEAISGDKGWVIILLALIGSGGLSALLTSGSGMRNNKSTRENALIDQYQERDKDRQAEIDQLKTQHAADRTEWEKRFKQLEDKTRVIIQYNYDLLKWASTGATPPPPEPPAEMYL